MKGARKVDSHDSLEFFRRRIFDRPERPNAGIVDQHLGWTKVALNLVGYSAYLEIVADITGDDLPTAGVWNTLGPEVEPDDLIAIMEKSGANCRSDTARCSSDHDQGLVGWSIGGRGRRRGHKVSFVSATSGYEVVVDQDECVSAGKCVATAPGFFVFDADQIADVNPDGVRPDDTTLLRIARACPSGAIRLVKDGVDIEI